MQIVPVILSGGSGTRLWPLSRAHYPKQFIRFFDGAGPSLLGETLGRLARAEGFAAPLIVANDEHRFLVREEAERSGTGVGAIILEPAARNTCPAITVAALHAVRADPDAVLAVMPSDHVIADGAAFLDAVRAAARIAATGKLVLFGITPDRPHTGYGYIRAGKPIEGGAREVAAFAEKPDEETAKGYLAEGGYYWNSGIFVLHARTFLDEVERLEPEIPRAAQAALDGARADLSFLRLDAAAFASSPSISVDYAVMEKTPRAAMLPLDVGWNDVGSWSSLWDVSPHDDAGNFVKGEALMEDSHGCYVHSGKAVVAAIGVDNLVIVDTPDALLVAGRDRAQDVSGIVEKLKRSNRREYEQHLRDYRPWGWFETLSLGPRFQVKLLHVKPGGKLSLQMHHHRSEHWTVVEGTALVTIGEEEKFVRENESVYITAAQWHRLENPGMTPLQIIEVQLGAYLGEDDIIRSDDVYNRG
ncbi:MAG: mannose-1-phosphate guanylyltransferase/mannose-6-phosphate isomerase [Hyphomicrobiales bacterium]